MFLWSSAAYFFIYFIFSLCESIFNFTLSKLSKMYSQLSFLILIKISYFSFYVYKGNKNIVKNTLAWLSLIQ